MRLEAQREVCEHEFMDMVVANKADVKRDIN